MSLLYQVDELLKTEDHFEAVEVKNVRYDVQLPVSSMLYIVTKHCVTTSITATKETKTRLLLRLDFGI